MKIMDKIILTHQRAANADTSHPLQFGFTPGKSGLHAAFLLSEAIAEAKNKGDTLYVTSLDVQKAFDTVQHGSFLYQLHRAGVQGPWWNLKYDTYDCLMSQVVWNMARRQTRRSVSNKVKVRVNFQVLTTTSCIFTTSWR